MGLNKKSFLTIFRSASTLINRSRQLRINSRNGTDQVPSKQSKKKKLASARVANQKYDYVKLEKQPESVINEAISLTSIDDSFVKMTRNGEPNNLHLHLGHCGRKCRTVSSSSTDLHSRQKSVFLCACLPKTQR